MGKILDYIQNSGNGNYHCYKTKKLSLDTYDSDTIAYSYDDKAVVQVKNNIFAETDRIRKPTVSFADSSRSDILPPPIFSFFLDGSRRTYKVDDIAIGKKIFPIIAGQIIVGCCERKDRDTFKKFDLQSRIVIAMPDDFDIDDGRENFCRSYCEKLNNEISKISFIKEKGIKIDKLMLYKTDGFTEDKEKDFYKNRGVTKIQNEMTDEEQKLVAELCKQNKLDDENWLIKDGSIEYNPGYTNLDPAQWNNLRANYQNTCNPIINYLNVA